jgi:hypothetical protein
VQSGALAPLPPHLQLLPGYSTLDAGAQCLRPRFFGGKARCKALRSPGSGAAIRDLFLGKDAMQKPLAEAFDGARNARHFHQIDACPHQHDATVAQQPIFSVPPGNTLLKVPPWLSDAGSVRVLTLPGRPQKGWDLNLSALCSDDAARTVRFLTGAVMACGGCVLSRRFEPGDCAAIEFEFLRATCVEMYSVLIAAGLELSAESHHTLATLCQCTRETLEATAGDPVRAELIIRKDDSASRFQPGGRCGSPRIS